MKTAAPSHLCNVYNSQLATTWSQILLLFTLRIYIKGLYGMLSPLHRPGTICSVFCRNYSYTFKPTLFVKLHRFSPSKYFQFLRKLNTSYAICRRSHNILTYIRNKYSILNRMFVFPFMVQHLHWMENKISNYQQGDITKKDRSYVTS